MATCATCEYFKEDKGYSAESFLGGECINKLIASGSQHNPDNMMVTFGSHDGYGDYMNISPDFGCILHKKKVT